MRDIDNEVWGPKQTPKNETSAPVTIGTVPPQPTIRTAEQVTAMFENARSEAELREAEAAYEQLMGRPNPQAGRLKI